MTGVGYPQLSAVIECRRCGSRSSAAASAPTAAARCRATSPRPSAAVPTSCSAACLRAHDEAAGDVVTTEDGVFKRNFYGMSSRNAMDKYAGRRGQVPRGRGQGRPHSRPRSVESTIQDILGGVRSACTYVGARRLRTHHAHDLRPGVHAAQRGLRQGAVIRAVLLTQAPDSCQIRGSFRALRSTMTALQDFSPTRLP